MGRRVKLSLLLLAGAAMAVAAAFTKPPAAQVDVFTIGPAPRVDLSARPVRDALVRSVAQLGKDRALALVKGQGGAALASERVERQVLEAVSVRKIGHDRIRIRVASRDLAAAHAVAEAVRSGLVHHGMKERLRIVSETTGGRAFLVATLLTIVAILYIAAAAARAALGAVFAARSGRSAAARPLGGVRGAASTR
jgi:hypothetical protein